MDKGWAVLSCPYFAVRRVKMHFALCGIVLEKFGGYVLLRVFAHRNRMPSENWQDRNSPSPVLHRLYILLRAPCTSPILNIFGMAKHAYARVRLEAGSVKSKS